MAEEEKQEDQASQKAQNTQSRPKKQPSGPKLVKMVRDSDGKTADVHPDMVEEYAKGDFRKA